MNSWWRRRRRRLLRLWAIGIAASVVATILSSAGYLESNQARALDLLLQLRGRTPVSDVVVVAIDADAFRTVGRRQPLSREYIARVVRGAQRAGASVIGLDIALDTPTDEDAALADAIADFTDGGVSRVVIAETLADGPLRALPSRAGVLRASVDVPEDSDGVVRRAVLVFTQTGGMPLPSLALATAARATGVSPADLARRLEVAPQELVHLNLAGPAKTFLTIPSDAVAALGAPDAAAPSDNPLRGRIVLLGGTFPESRDFVLTAHGLLPGVELQANVVHMIINDRFVRPAGWVLALGIQILAVGVVAVMMVTTGAVVSTVGSLTLPFAIAVPASYLAFHSGGYWVDFVIPVVTTRLLGSIFLRVERHRIHQAFGRYVSKEIAEEVFADAPGLRGERRDVSILFSDLRSFTALSESRDPDEIAAQLNEYFDVMTTAIIRYRGMVNDFMGDGVMGIFGAPLDDRQHALHAVLAARDMERGLRDLNARWELTGRPLLQMGIGIHTGRVFAGNVGGRARFKYTLVGDAVNLASRVEGVNKETGTTVLITEATRALVGEHVRTRDCGLVPVKGRNEPVHVFELLAVEAPNGEKRA